MVPATQLRVKESESSLINESQQLIFLNYELYLVYLLVITQ